MVRYLNKTCCTRGGRGGVCYGNADFKQNLLLSLAFFELRIIYKLLFCLRLRCLLKRERAVVLAVELHKGVDEVGS